MIYFNVKTVREYLVVNGIVFTLRKPRSIGQTDAVTGSYIKHKAFAFVNIELEKENVTDPNLLCDYFDKSGLTRDKMSPYEWLELAQKMSGSILNLYKVTMIQDV